MLKTNSPACAAARGVSARFMPASTSHCAFDLVRLYPVTACPASSNRFTMRLPMTPRPTKPTFAIKTLQLFGVTDVWIFFVMVLRVGSGESAKKLQRTAAGVNHHVARACGTKDGIPTDDLGGLAVDPSLARPIFNVDHLFHTRMAVRVARMESPNSSSCSRNMSPSPKGIGLCSDEPRC